MLIKPGSNFAQAPEDNELDEEMEFPDDFEDDDDEDNYPDDVDSQEEPNDPA